MQLTQKESSLVKDLLDQEKVCVQKYEFYANSAKDPELKSLFETLKKDEQEHFDSLSELSKGTLPTVPQAKESRAASYMPKGTYKNGGNANDKCHDEFLCTDSIASEKLVSSTYNSDLFQFAATGIRKLLNHIQTEEQEHAEMIYKYKTANGMA